MTDGGPIHPQVVHERRVCQQCHGSAESSCIGCGGDGYVTWSFEHEGLSLRDYFAASALVGLFNGGRESIDILADMAYMTADAMLKRRQTKPE